MSRTGRGRGEARGVGCCSSAGEKPPVSASEPLPVWPPTARRRDTDREEVRYGGAEGGRSGREGDGRVRTGLIRGVVIRITARRRDRSNDARLLGIVEWRLP